MNSKLCSSDLGFQTYGAFNVRQELLKASFSKVWGRKSVDGYCCQRLEWILLWLNIAGCLPEDEKRGEGCWLPAPRHHLPKRICRATGCNIQVWGSWSPIKRRSGMCRLKKKGAGYRSLHIQLPLPLNVLWQHFSSPFNCRLPSCHGSVPLNVPHQGFDSR